MDDAPVLDLQAAEQVAIQAKYSGYIDRQQAGNRPICAAMRIRKLPADLDLDVNMDGLSNEVKQKLGRCAALTPWLAQDVFPG